MSTPPNENILDRVRKLLAQAESDGVTPAEAEAFTGRASSLMAKHGIDRARLGALHPETDKPGSKIIDIPNPWARVRASLLNGIAFAMNCQCVLLASNKPGDRVHLFGYESDLERTEILYTSLLLQMTSALNHAETPYYESKRAWSRSFLLGYVSAVTGRVKAAENQARNAARDEDRAAGEGTSTELVLADRSLQVKSMVSREYGKLRTTRATYSGGGYRDGHAEGRRASIGNSGVGTSGRRSLGSS